MKFFVSKEALLKRLTDIQGIVDKKTTMPILSHLLLDLRGDQPFIYATDLDTAIRELIEVKLEKKGALAIPARFLISAVKELEDEITVEEKDNYALELKSGKASIKINCLDPKEFPAWPEISDGVELTIPAMELKRLIEKTVYAASDADTRYVFNGILLHSKEGSLTAVGTDGHRLAMFKIQAGLDSEFKVILPKKAVSELKRLLEDETISLTIGKNHVLVKGSKIEFLTKVIEGSYPDYTQVIPKQAARRFIVKKAEFEKALKRVSIVSRERSNAVKLDMEGNFLRLSASHPDLGSASEEITIDYEGDAFTIGFNARYILESLAVIESDQIIGEFNDPLGPSLFKGLGDEEYISVIMPMRI